MRPLVVVAGRKGERRGLRLEQRLRLGEESRRWLPRLASRGQGRPVGQPAREGGAAAQLAQADKFLVCVTDRVVVLALWLRLCG
jgi:hypothetical protein